MKDKKKIFLQLKSSHSTENNTGVTLTSDQQGKNKKVNPAQ